jgi:hypothetical protein
MKGSKLTDTLISPNGGHQSLNLLAKQASLLVVVTAGKAAHKHIVQLVPHGGSIEDGPGRKVQGVNSLN